MKRQFVCTPLKEERHGRPGPVLVADVVDSASVNLHAGDVIVANELQYGDSASPSHAAPLIAGALRRRGLRVHLKALRVAPDWTFAGSGFDASQMVALQVCSDNVAAGHAPFRAITPAINQWAAAVGDREIVLASPRSFCAGVDRAIETVERALRRFGKPLYVRRQIVHNRSVVHDLEKKGAIFVDEVDDLPEGSTVILAAHGVAPSVRRAADARGLRVIDATCPLVAKVHTEVRRFAAKGNTVFLIGHQEHEEVVGSRGEAPESVVVVADSSEAEVVQPTDPDKVAYVMQTTLAADEAESTAMVLRDRFPSIATPPSEDICYATTNRQAAIRDLATHCDLVIVLGSSNSSNSLRLVEVAERSGTPAYLADNADSVDLGWLTGVRRLGITAGASAPPHLVDELVRSLAGLGQISLREPVAVGENVEFTLPIEVR